MGNSVPNAITSYLPLRPTDLPSCQGRAIPVGFGFFDLISGSDKEDIGHRGGIARTVVFGVRLNIVARFIAFCGTAVVYFTRTLNNTCVRKGEVSCCEELRLIDASLAGEFAFECFAIRKEHFFCTDTFVNLVQEEISILHSVAVVIDTGGAGLGTTTEGHTHGQIGVDAALHQSMVAHLDFDARISFVAPRFHQVLVQPLQVTKVLVGIDLGAGYPPSNSIASLLVQVTLAVHAFQSIPC